MTTPKQTATDTFCYPPLDRRQDIFQKDLAFAQALRAHIEFCTTETRQDAEDPDQIVIY